MNVVERDHAARFHEACIVSKVASDTLVRMIPVDEEEIHSLAAQQAKGAAPDTSVMGVSTDGMDRLARGSNPLNRQSFGWLPGIIQLPRWQIDADQNRISGCRACPQQQRAAVCRADL